MPSSTYTPIATYTVTGADAEVVFSSIPATYRDLVLVFNGGSTVSVKNLWQTMNSDTTIANYTNVQMSGTGTTFNSSVNAGAGAQVRTLTSFGYLENNLNGNVIVQIMDYSATDKHKTWLSRASHAENGVTAIAGRYASNSAITSLTYTTNSNDNFVIGSTFSLYGIAS